MPGPKKAQKIKRKARHHPSADIPSSSSSMTVRAPSSLSEPQQPQPQPQPPAEGAELSPFILQRRQLEEARLARLKRLRGEEPNGVEKGHGTPRGPAATSEEKGGAGRETTRPVKRTRQVSFYYYFLFIYGSRLIWRIRLGRNTNNNNNNNIDDDDQSYPSSPPTSPAASSESTSNTYPTTATSASAKQEKEKKEKDAGNTLFWDGELRQTATLHAVPRRDGRKTFSLTEILGPVRAKSILILSLSPPF